MKPQHFILVLLLIIGLGCKDDNNNTFPDNPDYVRTSLSISVTDIEGRPLEGAFVEIGSVSGVSGEDGILNLYNVEIEEETYVKASLPDFFTASKRFKSESNRIEFVALTMVRRTKQASLQSSAGGNITIDRVNIDFPAAAFQYENGSAYTGQVNFYGYTIYPDRETFTRIMPGNLEGIRTDQQRGILTSYGMLNLEIEDAGGEKLVLKDGSSATLTFEIASNQTSQAPATIPLWYFDEDKGYWIEEGMASRVGNTYVGDVNHFTIWNCDDWVNSLRVNVVFSHESGALSARSEVCFISPLGAKACEMTDSEGSVSANVEAGATYRVEISGNCLGGTNSFEIGPIQENDQTFYKSLEYSTSTTVNLKAQTCDGKPIENGLAYFTSGAGSFFYPVNKEISSFQVPNCGETVVSVILIDLNVNKESYTHACIPDAEASFNTVNACQNLDEFLFLRVQGFPQYTFRDVSFSEEGGLSHVRAQGQVGNQDGFTINFRMENGIVIASSSGQIDMPTGEFGHVLSLQLNITQLDDNRVSGQFSGVVSAGDNGQGGPEYSNFTGSFSVKKP